VGGGLTNLLLLRRSGMLKQIDEQIRLRTCGHAGVGWLSKESFSQNKIVN